MAQVQFKPRTRTDYIVVHCAATKPSMDIGVREITQWHVRDNGWLAVGYHYIIRRDGTVEPGRPVDVVGSHVKGFNERSIGICLVGGINDKGAPEANFTHEQYTSLETLLKVSKRVYSKAQIVGHTDLDSGKACPSFKVADWLKTVTI